MKESKGLSGTLSEEKKMNPPRPFSNRQVILWCQEPECWRYFDSEAKMKAHWKFEHSGNPLTATEDSSDESVAGEMEDGVVRAKAKKEMDEDEVMRHKMLVRMSDGFFEKGAGFEKYHGPVREPGSEEAR